MDYGVEEHGFCRLTTCTLNLTTRTLYAHNMHTASDSMHTAESNGEQHVLCTLTTNTLHVGICCRESLKNTRSDSRIVLASNPIVFRAGFTFVLHRLLRVGVLGRTGLGSVRSLGICTAFCSTLCWMAPDAPGPFRFLEIVVVVQVAEVLFVRHDRRVQPAVLQTKRPTLQTWNMTGAKPASCSPGRVVLVIAMACPCWKT